MQIAEAGPMWMWKIPSGSIAYQKVMQGEAPVYCFHLRLGGKAWMLGLFRPLFVYTPNVDRSVRLDAATNPANARLAGLDFPAHGEQ